MPRVAILIPSHINYEGQIDLLDECIMSLLKQTILPKSIYISISFENKNYKNLFVDKILRKYNEVMFLNLVFKFSNEKKYQMEHLNNICSTMDDNYDMLMFCDDDDTYDITRVEEFIGYFNIGKEQCNDFGGVREFLKCDNYRSRILGDLYYSGQTPEYWCYGVVPNALKHFFSMFKDKEVMLKHKFGDMYLRYYLRRNKKYSNWVGVVQDDKMSYNYNANNPNSICGKIEKGIGDSSDNILLHILHSNSDVEFNKIINNMKDKKMKLMSRYVYNFCKELYK